jgi:hypothetical protein
VERCWSRTSIGSTSTVSASCGTYSPSARSGTDHRASSRLPCRSWKRLPRRDSLCGRSTTKWRCCGIGFHRCASASTTYPSCVDSSLPNIPTPRAVRHQRYCPKDLPRCAGTPGRATSASCPTSCSKCCCGPPVPSTARQSRRSCPPTQHPRRFTFPSVPHWLKQSKRCSWPHSTRVAATNKIRRADSGSHAEPCTSSLPATSSWNFIKHPGENRLPPAGDRQA